MKYRGYTLSNIGRTGNTPPNSRADWWELTHPKGHWSGTALGLARAKQSVDERIAQGLDG